MSITWGDIQFEGPFLLETWNPSARAGVYAIMHKADPANEPTTYSIDYFGESGNLTDRGFPWGHHRSQCFIRRAGSRDNVYIAIHYMPGASEEDRRGVEGPLIGRYNPSCNREV